MLWQNEWSSVLLHVQGQAGNSFWCTLFLKFSAPNLNQYWLLTMEVEMVENSAEVNSNNINVMLTDFHEAYKWIRNGWLPILWNTYQVTNCGASKITLIATGPPISTMFVAKIRIGIFKGGKTIWKTANHIKLKFNLITEARIAGHDNTPSASSCCHWSHMKPFSPFLIYPFKGEGITDFVRLLCIACTWRMLITTLEISDYK